MKCLHVCPITKLDAFLPSLFVNTKIHKGNCVMYYAWRRKWDLQDAKEGIFNKVSNTRPCSMKKRHSASSREETWRQKRGHWPWGLWRDSSLLTVPVFLEFSMVSGSFTQTWLFTAQRVSELVCLLGDKWKYFIFELFYYSLTLQEQNNNKRG